MKNTKFLTGLVVSSLLFSNVLSVGSVLATEVEVSASEISKFVESENNDVIPETEAIVKEEQSGSSEDGASSLTESKVSEKNQETVTSETAPIVGEQETVATESDLTESVEKETEKQEVAEQPGMRGAMFKSPNPEVQKMIDALTPEDRAKAVGSDGLGEEMKVIPEVKAGFGQYPNVNQYIAEKGFKNPTITRDSRFGTTPKNEFKYEKPIGIVIHETANPNSTIDGEVNFMFNNWQNAFVHAYASGNRVIETAPTDYLSWGAGPNANPYYIHIELCRSKSFDDFARSVNSDSYWVASKLVEFNLQPSFGDNDGLGSIISHNGIANFWGGTDHTDPIAYFAQWGYTMSEFYDLVVKKYNILKGEEEGSKELATVTESQTVNKNMKIKNGDYYFYSQPYKTKGSARLYPIKYVRDIGDTVHVIKKIKTSQGVVEYQLSGDSEVNNYYVDEKALQDFETITERKPINKNMKVVDDGFYIYSRPFNTEGSKRVLKVSKKYPKGTTVKVLEEIKTSQGVVVYKLAENEYVDHNTMKDFETITERKPINKNMKVVDDGFYIYSQPFNTEGSKRVLKVSKKYPKGTTVKVLEEIKTSQGVVVYKLAENEYVDHNTMKDFETITERKPINKNMKVVDDGFYIYSQPFNTEGSKRVLKVSKKYPKGTTVKVLEEIKTSQGVVVYKLAENEYVDCNTMKDFETVTERKPINKNMKVVDDGFYIYSQPFNTEGSKRV
ncbi:GW dipeptide domain-containing protein, partial [Vagococcus fessus]